MREPYARRGELWQHAENMALESPAPEDEHPEIMELILIQANELRALVASHATERLRLRLALKREERADA